MPLKPSVFSFSGVKKNTKSQLEGVIYLATFFPGESNCKALLVAAFSAPGC